MKDRLDIELDVDVVEVFTIGYEGSELSAFINRLVDAGVETLVDIRDLPSSRKKGFSKKALSEALEACGIKYLHLKSLGDPREGRLAARAGDHDRFVSVFTRHMATPAAQAALHELAHLVKTTRACLMCFERHHRGCHRKIVVEDLAQIVSMRVNHIAVPDRSRGCDPCCGHY